MKRLSRVAIFSGVMALAPSAHAEDLMASPQVTARAYGYIYCQITNFGKETVKLRKPAIIDVSANVLPLNTDSCSQRGNKLKENETCVVGVGTTNPPAIYACRVTVTSKKDVRAVVEARDVRDQSVQDAQALR